MKGWCRSCKKLQRVPDPSDRSPRGYGCPDCGHMLFSTLDEDRRRHEGRATELKRDPEKQLQGKPKRRAADFDLRAFHEAARENGCALSYLGGCGGLFAGHMVWGHHYLPKQRLKHNAAAYKDPRNGVGLCVNHHAQVEAHRPGVECPRPPFFDEFLADHGLTFREARAA